MAESRIILPPDSSGKGLHTRSNVVGANTVEDQVVRLAEFGGLDSVFFSASATNRAVNEWAALQSFKVPVGYKLHPLFFRALSATAGYGARATYARKLGSYNLATGVYTDAAAAQTPGHFSGLFAVAMTATNAVAVTLTFTYVNEENTAGRTTTLAIPASSPAQAKWDVPFGMLPGSVTGRNQPDNGIRDLTAVGRSVTTATGTIDFYGFDTLAYSRLLTANLVYEFAFDPHLFAISAGDFILLESNSYAVAVASILQERQLGFQLVPE